MTKAADLAKLIADPNTMLKRVVGNWRFTSNFSNSGNGADEDITANWEEADDAGYARIGSAMTHSSGIFTFPQTGVYQIQTRVSYQDSGSASSGVFIKIKYTANNSDYDLVASGTGMALGTANRPMHITASAIIDITDTSTCKVKFTTNGGTYITYFGDSAENKNCFSFIRLGDT